MSYSFRGHLKTVILSTHCSVFNHGLFNITPLHEQILQHSFSITVYLSTLNLHGHCNRNLKFRSSKLKSNIQFMLNSLTIASISSQIGTTVTTVVPICEEMLAISFLCFSFVLAHIL
jgi:hypothetical protein